MEVVSDDDEHVEMVESPLLAASASSAALTAQDLDLPDYFEPSAHPVTLSDGPIEDFDGPLTEADEAEFLRLSEEDISWSDAAGDRYVAMLVLPDGTAYGQKGPSPEQIVPDEENGYGGWEGVDPESGSPSSQSSAISPEEMAHGMAILDALAEGDPPRPGVDASDLPPPIKIVGNSLNDDGRARIAVTHLLKLAPHRRIGALNQTTSPGFTGCTGSKIGPRAVLTAAHCVLMANGSWITSGQFHPGQTRTEHPNTGGTSVAWGGVLARDWRIDRKWDYAILFLDDRLDSFQLGWLGVQWFNTASSYDGKPMWLHGYPRRDAVPSDWINTGKDTPLPGGSCGGWMYGMWLVMFNSFLSGEQLGYTMDTSQGQSGSAVRYDNNAIGVHWGSRSNENFNRAARFRSSMWNDVCSWITLVPSVHGQHGLCD